MFADRRTIVSKRFFFLAVGARAILGKKFATLCFLIDVLTKYLQRVVFTLVV